MAGRSGLRFFSYGTWDRPLRAVIAIVGGYYASDWLVAAFALLCIVGFGMARDGAVILAALLGFFAYLGILIWGFAEQKLSRLTIVLLLLCAASFALMRILTPYGPLHTGG